MNALQLRQKNFPTYLKNIFQRIFFPPNQLVHLVLQSKPVFLVKKGICPFSTHYNWGKETPTLDPTSIIIEKIYQNKTNWSARKKILFKTFVIKFRKRWILNVCTEFWNWPNIWHNFWRNLHMRIWTIDVCNIKAWNSMISIR